MTEDDASPKVYSYDTRVLPKGWLYAVSRLIREMAREGVSIEGCEDPADLMSQLADFLGVGDADDSWAVAVERIRG